MRETDIKVIIMPKRLTTVMARNNMSINKIVDYSTIRTIFTVDDLVELAIYNNYDQDSQTKLFRIKESLDLPYLFSRWFDTRQGCGVELDSTVIPLSHNEKVRAQIVERVVAKFPPADQSLSNEKPFEFINASGNLWVLAVSDEYGSFEADPENYLSVCRTIVHELYDHYPTAAVNRTQMFAAYVRALNAVKH